MDCQLCQSPGCNMVCGTVATEAIAAISQATAIQFQMQKTMNCSKPTPFPTTLEADSLDHAYNIASTRGYPTTPALTALSQHMGVDKKEVKGWFAEVRMAKGHITQNTATRREAAQLPPESTPPWSKLWHA